MNTDNMSVAGETIDFGPCAFMDHYKHDKVFSSIDFGGRYAYSNQPAIAQWNIAQFATTLVPLIDADVDRSVELATQVVESFSNEFENAWLEVFGRKIGLLPTRNDSQLIVALLELMAEGNADFTLTFRNLSEIGNLAESEAEFRSAFTSPANVSGWILDWRKRLETESRSDSERQTVMRNENPLFIPRNHQIERVISAALVDNFSLFEEMVDVVCRPYEYRPEYLDFTLPPRPEEVVQRTFCGT